MKKERIEDALLKINIPLRIKGFEYIIEAIMLLDTEEWKHSKWIALYREIGEKFGTTESRVERSIRNAFGKARDVQDNSEIVKHYIGLNYTSNSASLSQLYLMLKREEENEKSNA